MGFGPDDIAVVHGAAPKLAPLVPALVDAVHDRLIQQDATWRHFLPRQTGLALDRNTEVKTLRAFGKLLWIQNDLIARHYAR